jgi:hypothetical protein
MLSGEKLRFQKEIDQLLSDYHNRFDHFTVWIKTNNTSKLLGGRNSGFEIWTIIYKNLLYSIFIIFYFSLVEILIYH